MPFEVKPFVGIGDVKFGMDKEDIISIMGEPTEVRDDLFYDNNPDISTQLISYKSFHPNFYVKKNGLTFIGIENRRRAKRDEIIFCQEPLFISAKALVMDYYYKYENFGTECILSERHGKLLLPEYGMSIQTSFGMSLTKKAEVAFIYSLDYPADEYFPWNIRKKIAYGADFTLRNYLKLPNEQRLKSKMLSDER